MFSNMPGGPVSEISPDLPSDSTHAAPPAARRVVFTCYALLALVLAYTLITRFFLPLYWTEPIGVERGGAAIDDGPDGSDAGGPLNFDQRINPETADWPELMRLPGIGEITAKRIVACRQEHRRQSDQPVFRCAEDLAKVRGIGPKTVEALRPHLKFDDR